MDDLVLLSRYVGRDDADAIKSLVLKHRPMVLATCRRRLGSQADAEDAMQDVFLLFIQNAGRIRSNIGGWLRRCAGNTADHLARNRRKQTHYESQRARIESASFEGEATLREQLAILAECLGRLNPSDQGVLVQSYVAEKTQEQIAASMGISRQAVAKRIAKATVQLRHQMTAKGVIVSVVAAFTVLFKRIACTIFPHGVQTSLTSAPSIPAASAGAAGAGTVGAVKAGVAVTLVLTAAAVTYEVVEDRHHENSASQNTPARTAVAMPVSEGKTLAAGSWSGKATMPLSAFVGGTPILAWPGAQGFRAAQPQGPIASDWSASNGPPDPSSSALGRWQLPPMSQYQHDVVPTYSYTPSPMQIASSRWLSRSSPKAKTAQSLAADSDEEMLTLAVTAIASAGDGESPVEPSVTSASVASAIMSRDGVMVASPAEVKPGDVDPLPSVTVVVAGKQRTFTLASRDALVPISVISITKDKAVSITAAKASLSAVQWTTVGSISLVDVITKSVVKVVPSDGLVLSNAISAPSIITSSSKTDSASIELVVQDVAVVPIATAPILTVSPIKTISVATTVQTGAVFAAAGTLDGPLVNQGMVIAKGGTETPLLLAGPVSGRGSYTGEVVFAGGFSPGNSPAAVHLDCATLGASNALTMELAGLTPGSQYDRLIIGNHLTLGGSLDVKLLYGFTPRLGDSFTLFKGDFSGQFSDMTLPALGDGLRWDTGDLYSGGSMEVVPEPATMTLLATGGLILMLRRHSPSPRT